MATISWQQQKAKVRAAGTQEQEEQLQQDCEYHTQAHAQMCADITTFEIAKYKL